MTYKNHAQAQLVTDQERCHAISPLSHFHVITTSPEEIQHNEPRASTSCKSSSTSIFRYAASQSFVNDTTSDLSMRLARDEWISGFSLIRLAHTYSCGKVLHIFGCFLTVSDSGSQGSRCFSLQPRFRYFLSSYVEKHHFSWRCQTTHLHLDTAPQATSRPQRLTLKRTNRRLKGIIKLPDRGKALLRLFL